MITTITPTDTSLAGNLASEPAAETGVGVGVWVGAFTKDFSWGGWVSVAGNVSTIVGKGSNVVVTEGSIVPVIVGVSV